HHQSVLARVDADRRLLVLQARLLGPRRQELAGLMAPVLDHAGGRRALHVDVEQAQEDRDAPRRAVQVRRLLDLRDLHDLPVRRRQDQVRTALALPLGVAEEEGEREREDDGDVGHQPDDPAPGDRSDGEADQRDDGGRGDEDVSLAGDGHAYCYPAEGGVAPGSCVGNSSSVKPVRRRKTSRYRADVASTTSGGRSGGGGSLFHSPAATSASRKSRTGCLSSEGCPRPTAYCSCGQKREESGVSTSSISSSVPSGAWPNANLVSAMMMPFSAASARPRS